MHPSIETTALIEPTPYENMDKQAICLDGYDQTYQQFSPGHFQGRFSTQHIDHDFSLFFESVNVRVNQKILVPNDRYGICIFDTTSDTQVVNGNSVEGGSLMLMTPGSEFDVVTSDNMRVLVIDVNKELVQSSLLYQTLPIFKEASTYRAIVSSNFEMNSALLRSTNQLLTDINNLSHLNMTAPPVSRRTEIATLALATFGDPRFIKTINWNNSRGKNRFETYVTIRNYLDTQISNEICWETVAEKYGVSRRYIETLFFEFTQLTPARYVKVRRLNEIKRTLLSDCNSRSSIADIGAEFGHWHESRLSQNYKNLFNELPSQTRSRVRNVFHD